MADVSGMKLHEDGQPPLLPRSSSSKGAEIIKSMLIDVPREVCTHQHKLPSSQSMNSREVPTIVENRKKPNCAQMAAVSKIQR